MERNGRASRQARTKKGWCCASVAGVPSPSIDIAKRAEQRERIELNRVVTERGVDQRAIGWLVYHPWSARQVKVFQYFLLGRLASSILSFPWMERWIWITHHISYTTYHISHITHTLVLFWSTVDLLWYNLLLCCRWIRFKRKQKNRENEGYWYWYW